MEKKEKYKIDDICYFREKNSTIIRKGYVIAIYDTKESDEEKVIYCVEEYEYGNKTSYKLVSRYMYQTANECLNDILNETINNRIVFDSYSISDKICQELHNKDIVSESSWDKARAIANDIIKNNILGLE